MPADSPILPPRYLDPERIGRGGMGEIFHAVDSVLNRDVAVKVLADPLSQDESVRGRFTREALAAARLSGEPNTVTIFDVGEWQQRPFIVMAYLPGGSLEGVLREGGAQQPGETLEWVDEAGRALDAAHRHGIVHRDVKPANLLLDRERSVHVADFGIASAAGMDSLTKPGTVLGTAGYLSPEQARGERATPASDRYALAVVAFELLTGTRPFESDTPTAEAAAHVHAAVPSIRGRNPDLPRELDPVFERALAKEPAGRYATCAELVGAVRGALADAAGKTRPLAVAPARPSSPATRAPALGAARRRSLSWPLTLAGIVVAAALAGVGLAAVLSGGDEEGATPTSAADAPAPPAARTVVETVFETLPGTTLRETVVREAPATSAPTASPPATAPTGGGSTREGIAQTDESTSLIEAGRYDDALPVAQEALANLEGSGHVYEAYASYNVGRSLAELGRCDEALAYIDRSQAIQGHRREFDRVRAACGAGSDGDGDD